MLDAPSSTQVVRPVRPIHDWIALTQAQGLSMSPAQAMQLVRASLAQILRYGAPVMSEAVWLDTSGRVEIVLPGREQCSESDCLASLGCLACELISGEPIHDAPPSLLLTRARFKVMANPKDFQEWTPRLEWALGRLLGLLEPFQGMDEAHEALGTLESQTTIWFPNEAYAKSAREAPFPNHRPHFGQAWIMPAVVGALGASTLLLGVGMAYLLGRSHTPTPPAPTQSAARDGRIILDQKTLALLLSAKPQRSPRPARAKKSPPAPVAPKEATPPPPEAPLEPTYVGGVIGVPPSRPGVKGHPVDPHRSTDPFVAKG